MLLGYLLWLDEPLDAPDWDCDRCLMVESCVVLALPVVSPMFTLDLPRASIVVFGLTCTSVEDDCCELAPC